jgi:hypothetical protein
MKQLFIKAGITSFLKKDKAAKGLFDMTKWFKKMLNKFNISFVDECCPCDETNLPVRYNKTEDEVQYFDCETQTWTNTVVV